MPQAYLNVTPIVEAVFKVLVRPYHAFLAELVADGRITRAELDEVRDHARAQMPHLRDLVKAELGPEIVVGAKI